MKISLVVPTLNELYGLNMIMPQIKREWVDQIIILDGNSKDGSKEWAESQGYEVFCQKQNGMWYAYKELFESGIIKGDVVITFSPDGNSIPEAIPPLIEKMKQGYDMVIASRYKTDKVQEKLALHYIKARSQDDTRLTRIGNWLLTGLVNMGSQFFYTDSLVMYRAYKADLPKRLGFLDNPDWVQRKLIKLSGLYGWESSMSIRASKLNVAEIPADEPHAFRVKRRQNAIRHGLTILIQILHEEFCKMGKVKEEAIYTVPMTKSEICGLGERRWMRKHWKKVAITLGIPFVVWAGALMGISEDVDQWIRSLAYLIPLGVMFYFLWRWSYVDSTRAGKELFKSINKES